MEFKPGDRVTYFFIRRGYATIKIPAEVVAVRPTKVTIKIEDGTTRYVLPENLKKEA